MTRLLHLISFVAIAEALLIPDNFDQSSTHIPASAESIYFMRQSLASVPLFDQSIYFVRHAQSIHNVMGDHHHDTLLTLHGIEQARGLKEKSIDLLYDASLDLVFSSPLKRAMQTSQLLFSGTIVLQPYLIEVGSEPCDKGSSIAELKSTFANHSVFDFSLLEQMEKENEQGAPSVWYKKDVELQAGDNIAKDRRRILYASKFLKWLTIQKKPRHVWIVTHQGVIQTMTGKTLDNAKIFLANSRNMDYGKDL